MEKVILIILPIFFIRVEALLDFKCLKCLCVTASKCQPLLCDPETCDVSFGNYNCACGYFGITPPYWIAANRPYSNETYINEKDKFIKCVETKKCAIRAVQYYMEKYAKDCDRNNVIDCDDYVLIHSFGPGSCGDSSLDKKKLDRYNACMGKSKPTTTERPMTTKDMKNSTRSI